MKNSVSRIIEAATRAAEGYSDLVVESAKISKANRKLRELDIDHSFLNLSSKRNSHIGGLVSRIVVPLLPLLVEYTFRAFDLAPKKSATAAEHDPKCPNHPRHSAPSAPIAPKPSKFREPEFYFAPDKEKDGDEIPTVDEIPPTAVHVLAALERDAKRRGNLGSIEYAIVALNNYLIDPDFDPNSSGATAATEKSTSEAGVTVGDPKPIGSTVIPPG